MTGIRCIKVFYEVYLYSKNVGTIIERNGGPVYFAKVLRWSAGAYARLSSKEHQHSCRLACYGSALGPAMTQHISQTSSPASPCKVLDPELPVSQNVVVIGRKRKCRAEGFSLIYCVPACLGIVDTWDCFFEGEDDVAKVPVSESNENNLRPTAKVPKKSSLKTSFVSLLTRTVQCGYHVLDKNQETTDDNITVAEKGGTTKSLNNNITARTHNHAAEVSIWNRYIKRSRSGRDATTSEVKHDHIASKFEDKLPPLSEESALVSESFRKDIYDALPLLIRGHQWDLLYSTLRHGISLRTLYRRSFSNPGPSMLVMEDSKGAVFGAFISTPLKPGAQRKYQGTNDTFVFTNVNGDPQLFKPTGRNRYYVLCTNGALALGGGGHFALHLDGDLLTGSSGESETFGNCCLANSEDFTVKNVELWGFSKYTTKSSAAKPKITT